MTVIFITKVDGSKDDAGSGTYDEYLIAKFILLMFLALADALYFRLMDGINLFPAVTLLQKDGLKYPEQLIIVMVIPEIAFKFPDQSSCYCPQFPVSLNGLVPVLGMIPETRVAIDTLQYKGIALSKRKSKLMHDAKYFVHYLSVQLRIGRKGDILFLNGRIDKGCIVMILVIIFIVHTNAFLENKFNTLFTDTVTEMD